MINSPRMSRSRVGIATDLLAAHLGTTNINIQKADPTHGFMDPGTSSLRAFRIEVLRGNLLVP